MVGRKKLRASRTLLRRNSQPSACHWLEPDLVTRLTVARGQRGTERGVGRLQEGRSFRNGDLLARAGDRELDIERAGLAGRETDAGPGGGQKARRGDEELILAGWESGDRVLTASAGD